MLANFNWKERWIMKKQPINNGYTRCNKCSEVYQNAMKTCPKCGTKNPAHFLNEDELSSDMSVLIAEHANMVFNIID